MSKNAIIGGAVAVAVAVGGFLFYKNQQHQELVGKILRKTEVIASVAELPRSLNPLTSRTKAGMILADPLFDGLSNLSGQAVDEYQQELMVYIEQDGAKNNVYHIELNTEKVWHDSADHHFSAADVKHTFDVIMNPENESPLRGRLSRQIKELVVKDDANIDIIFKEAVAPGMAPKLLAFKIIPATYLGEKMGTNMKTDPVAQKFNRSPIGTGPFRFKSWEGNDIKLERVKQKPLDLESADENTLKAEDQIRVMTFTLVQDLEKQAKMLIDGKIDLVLDSDPDLHPKLMEAGLKHSDYLSHHFYALVANAAKAPFNKKNNRQGIARAVNKPAALGTVWTDKPENYVNVGPFPRNAPRQYESFKELNPYNVAHAKKLLADIQGQQVSLIFPEAGNVMERVAGQLVQDLNAAGLQVESKALGMAFDTQLQNGNYDLALVRHDGFTKGYDITPLFHSKSQQNISGWGNASFDKLLTDWQNTGFWEQKLPLGIRIHETLSAEAPYSFLFTMPTRAFYSDRLQQVIITDPSALLAAAESWTVNK